MAGVALTALGGLWWPTGFSADAVDAAALCVAGLALGHIMSHPHSFHVAGVALAALGGFSADAVDAAALCVAGVALGDIHLHFAWQAWH